MVGDSYYKAFPPAANKFSSVLSQMEEIGESRSVIVADTYNEFYGPTVYNLLVSPAGFCRWLYRREER